VHSHLKRVIGVIAVPLLGSALAVGATALPAHATTWSDTGLSAGPVTAGTFAGPALGAANGSTLATAGDITLSGGTGVTWSLDGTPPPGVTVSGTTISYSGTGTGGGSLVADATDSAGNAEALQISVALTPGSVQIPVGDLVVTDSLSALTGTTTAGTVTFSATSSAGNITYAESNLPTGLVSGNPTLTYVGGTAAPGTYSNVKVTATDAGGAVLNGTFSLTVTASGGGPTIGTAGDEVNRFGNGFDVYRQHQYPGAVIAGWPATQPDPATHFQILAGTHAGAVKFEYAPNGTGTGLCVSDPRGGWASDPLTDGLILAWCNTGPFQQFVAQSNGTLKNVASGLYVNPAGKGAQLRGGNAPTTWGGSSYTWTEYNNLPV
jgi:hypothetical protein